MVVLCCATHTLIVKWRKNREKKNRFRAFFQAKRISQTNFTRWLYKHTQKYSLARHISNHGNNGIERMEKKKKWQKNVELRESSTQGMKITMALTIYNSHTNDNDDTQANDDDDSAMMLNDLPVAPLWHAVTFTHTHTYTPNLASISFTIYIAFNAYRFLQPTLFSFCQWSSTQKILLLLLNARSFHWCWCI